MTAPWAVTHTVHVWPVADLVEHEHIADCPCHPTETILARDDGALTFEYVHHSLDGRELTEA